MKVSIKKSPSKKVQSEAEKFDDGIQDDFADLMKEEMRMEECIRFDQTKIDNLQKLQHIQLQIKSANKQRDGEKTTLPSKLAKQQKSYEEEDLQEDVYEDYFEKQMMKDMEGIEEYEQQIDYFEELKKVEEKVSKTGHSKKHQQYVDDALEEEYLLQNIIGGEEEETKEQCGYLSEYEDIIN